MNTSQTSSTIVADATIPPPPGGYAPGYVPPPPPDNVVPLRPAQRAPKYDRNAIGYHFELMHRAAARANVQGKLVLFAEPTHNAPVRNYHFNVGDHEGMTDKAMELEYLNYNIRAAWVIFRPDLDKTSKGGKADALAIFGFGLDGDSETGSPTFPVAPDYAVQSSANNQHPILLLDRALTPEEAQDFANALKSFAPNAEGASDYTRSWRVPGTLNFPTLNKIQKGRSPEPFAVATAKPYDGTLTKVDDLRAALADHWQKPRTSSTTAQASGFYRVSDAEEMLEHLNEHGEFNEYEDWIKAGMALKVAFGEDEGLRLWKLTHDSTVTDDVEATKWNSFESKPKAGGVTINSLMKRAKDSGWKGGLKPANMTGGVTLPPGAGMATVPLPSSNGYVSLTGGGPRPQIAVPEYAEMEIAARFVQTYGEQLSYIRSRKQWLHWDGKRWHRDQTGFVADLASRHCRAEAALAAQTPKITEATVRSICSDRTRKAVMNLAGDDQSIATLAGDWDSNPWLLGTPDGVVDLKTGTLRAARPEDRVTKSTSVVPGGDCPIWQAFLTRATEGNAELHYYLQRLAGYALTGDTSEESLHFCHGPGGGGKGTFSHAIEGILADYHTSTDIATLTESKQDRHPTELAALQGARLVTCSETERGKRWNETRIKKMTGRDIITARFMGGDFFDYQPTFKILVSGNHKPNMRADTGMRRRFQLIPFVAKISASERDTNLGEKLRAEWGGILGWMIAGCAMWQRDRLSPPEVVRAATDEYMEEEAEDCLSQWLAECCDADPTAETPSTLLYESYVRYAERSSEKPMSNVLFGKTLRQPPLEYTVKRTKRGAIVLGLKLAPPPPPPVPRPPY